MATGFASGAFVFLAKIFSKHLLSMDLEHFKAQLKADNETALERLKADLRIAAFQQETTFARLHEKRAEVIAELYGRLESVHRAMQVLLDPSPLDGGADRAEREQKAADAGNAFGDYYHAHQIYFEESLCELLHRFDQDMVQAWWAHRYNPIASSSGMEPLDRRFEGWKRLEQQVPPIRKKIEATFRQLIGITPSSTDPTKAE